MVASEQIRELPRKYAIGKRPLSRVLGWGELTYTRMLEGSVPSPQHARELQEVLDDPFTYLMLLDRAHDAGIVTDFTYEKSKKAASSYLDGNEHAEKLAKLHAVARYMCTLAKGDVTPHALHLLVYYAHGLSFVKLPEPIVGVLPRAADDGPSYDGIAAWFTFERIQEAGREPVDESSSSLTGAERKLLRAAFAKYGVYSATKLQEMACSEAPWRKARKRAAEASAGGMPSVPSEISAKSMRKQFGKSAK